MPLRQIYLGADSHHTLGLYRRPQYMLTASQTCGACIIDRLADELLAEILWYLCPWEYFYNPSDENSLWWAIPLTCSRWHRVFTPMLYCKLDPSAFYVNNTYRVRRLQRTLSENPQLGTNVRYLTLSVTKLKATASSYNLNKDLLQRCQLVRSLTLHMSMVPQCWPILKMAAALPCLTKLYISGFIDGPAVQIILHYFNLPTLTELRVSRLSFSSNDNMQTKWRHIIHPSLAAIQKAFTSSHATSAVTSLTLEEPDCSPSVIRSFMNWPAHLERVSLSYLCHSAYAPEYTPDTIQNVLDCQQKSLQHISIGIIPVRGFGIPTFTAFKQLTTLQLSKYNLLVVEPCQAYRMLAAPSLQRLTIHFNTEDQHQTHHSEFGTEQALWFQRFAECKKPPWRATIHIDFAPDLPWGEIDQPPWPWTYLEQARQSFERHDMRMTWTTPPTDRQGWDAFCGDQRESTVAADV